MQEEKIIKGYDPVIMRKLLRFLGPYWPIVIISVIALLLSTGAELLQPIILQRAIDNHIVVEYYRIQASDLTPSLRSELKVDPGAPHIGGWVYIRNSNLKSVSAARQKALEAKGTLDVTSWYVFRIPETNRALAELVQSRPDLFHEAKGWGVIATSAVSKLSKSQRALLKQSDVSAVLASALRYMGLLLAVLVFSFVQVYFTSLMGQGVMKDLRLKLLNHTMRQSMAYMNGHPVGSLVTRVTNDVETINELFASVATSLLQDVALMGGVVVTIFILSPKLGLVAVLTLPPVVIMTVFFRVKARDAYRRVRLWVSRVNAYLAEHIAGVDVVRMFAREARSVREFVDHNGNLLRANLSEMYVFAIFRPLTNLFTSVSIGVVVYFGAGMVVQSIVTLGVLIAFLNLINKFYQPVMDISEKFTVLQSAMAGGERVFDLLETDSKIPDSGRLRIEGKPDGEIVFDRVQFEYKSDEPVLRDLSFTIKPGENVAIVGYTGAGKTTIINLLARMYDVTDGAIRLDGHDIRDYPLSDLRRVILPVQQDVFIFSGTVEENISLGRRLSLEAVRSAARTVNADRFIERLPDGYRTVLHEGGSNLSTGQRQLLSFARVVAHDPQIVVLDEATASIDTETERLIQEALNRLLAGRTSLVIAHRLSTIKHADRILVISGGRLAEAGTHQELLERRGAYHALYRLQYGEQEGG